MEQKETDSFSVNHAYFSGLYYLSYPQQIENYSQSIKAAVPSKKHKQIYKKSVNGSDLEKFVQPECLKGMDIVRISCGSNNWVAITSNFFFNSPFQQKFKSPYYLIKVRETSSPMGQRN